jgi:hypothetical protein
VFRVVTVPPHSTIIQFIKEHSDFVDACRSVGSPRSAGLSGVAIPSVLFAGIKAAAEEAITQYGLHGWLSSEGRESGGSYRSLSLTFNPDLVDPGIEDVHQSTLGTSANRSDEFYFGSTQRIPNLKHSYFDTYGFRQQTPASKIGMLGQFMSECGISLVRSRLSVLTGGDDADRSFKFGWHRDESVFENLRINIPITTHPNYRLQIEHEQLEPNPDSAHMTTHHLESGQAYSFDTHKPHRAFSVGPCDVRRIHLVLGFSPWLSYDAAEDGWKPNKFYGRVHPLDMLCDGLVHPALKALS